MLPSDSRTLSTCNIVIEKEGEKEIICGQAATQIIYLANPDNHEQITAIVLVCDAHGHALDEGKALIAVGENGTDRIGVQYVPNSYGKEEEIQ